MKTFKNLRKDQYFKHMSEDGMGGGIAVSGPTNTVGTGAIAGAGQPPGSKSGEPGVDLRKRRKNTHNPVMMGMGARKPPKM